MYAGRVYPAANMSVAYAYPPQLGGGVPAAMDGYGSMQGSFAFRKRFERIDWKKIASADIDSISRNLDFNALQDNIMNITFCNIESEVDIRLMDPNFLKLFKLAQLTIEYLLHSQDYLSSMVGNLEVKLKKASEEHAATKKQMEKTQSELAEVKKECHKRKKMLVAQQQILQDGANAYNKCLYCSKAFINQTFLQSHLARRHPEHLAQVPPSEPGQQQQHVMPLAESQGQVSQEKAEQLEKALEEMRQMLSRTEEQLVEERNARNKAERLDREQKEDARQREQSSMLEKLRAEQKQQHREEMKTMEDLFTKKLNEVNSKYKAQTAMVEGLQAKLNARSHSGRGDNEIQHEKEELRKQREEVAMMKENLQDQVKRMESQLNKQMREKEKKLQQEMSDMQHKHHMQLEELNEALEQSTRDRDKEEVQNHYKQTLKEATFVLEHTIEREQSHREQQQVRQQPDEQKQQSIKDQVQKATAATPTGLGRMEPPSDDETTELQEATTTMGTGGPSTLRTLQGTGSLSLNATRQAQLMEAIKKNPEFLRGMKQQLVGVFEDMLEKRGVSKNATGMSNEDCSKKLAILKQERQQKAPKLPNYWDIRQQYINEVDHLARQRLQQQRKTQGPPQVTSLSSSAPLPSGATKSRPQSAVSTPAQRGAPVQRSKSEGQARKPPVASPRATLQSTRSTNRESLDSQGDEETVTSTQWESSEEDDDDEDETETETEESEGVDEVDSRKPAARGQHQPARYTPTAQRQPAVTGQRQPAGRTGVSTTTTTKRVTTSSQKKVFEESDDDESWSDEPSEFKDVLDPETPRPQQSSSKPQVRSTSTPKGENVARLSQSIEEQLQGRAGKKPVGGINTVTGQKQSAQSDEDDDVSLESVSDIDIPSATPKPRQAATRSSTHTNYSTDTYGTSAWGTGSRAASTVHGGHERTSVNKSVSKASTSGDVEGSDWDSDDDDLDIKDL